MELKDFFRENPRVAVACSGGVDSVFLLYQARKYAQEVNAYFVKSAFQPEFEQEDACRSCEEIGVQLHVIEVDVLGEKDICSNPSDRCYYCKKAIFQKIKERAAADGCEMLLEGTNASDDASDRPGMRALAELGVRSPLRECGYTKERIREEARRAGLFVHNKPAYACLATRIPQGTAITGPLLKKVERAEQKLFELGFTDFRVRVFHGAARIQLPDDQLSLFLERRVEAEPELKKYFETVLLDIGVHR